MAPDDANGQHRPGRPRAASLAARRAGLLDTARTLFLAKGYAGVSLAEIARTAHVAVRTIYFHHGGKSGLLRAVLAQEDERHRAELAALDLDRKAIPERLASLALHLAERVGRPELLRLSAVVLATEEEALIACLERAGPGLIRAALRPALASVFAAAPPRELHSPEALCDHFFACIVGWRQPAAPSAMAAPERARRGFDLFLRALQSNLPT